MRGILLGLGVAGALAATLALVRQDGGGSAPPDVVPEAPLSAPEPAIPADRPRAGGSARAENATPGLVCELLRADMRTPAAGRSLQIYAYTPGKMALPEYRTTARTGEDGRVRVGELAPGHYVICGPGASPRDTAPRVARVEVGSGSAEAILVESADERPVRVEVRADYAPRFGIAPKVVLTRLDDDTGARFEQPGVLRPGVVAFDLQLPRGDYTVGVLPEGELLLAGASSQIRVTDPSTPLILDLVENRARVDVILKGLPADELPARVHAQPALELSTDLPERTWWGPFKWHRPDMTVPTLSEPRRILVFGARGTFRSAMPVDVSRDRVEVPLEAANRLVVEVYDWDPVADRGLVLDVQAGDEVCARVLTPRFGDGYPELERPALGGELVVPAGVPLVLVGRRADGTEAFRRELAPAEPPVEQPVRVSIGAPQRGRR